MVFVTRGVVSDDLQRLADVKFQGLQASRELCNYVVHKHTPLALALV